MALKGLHFATRMQILYTPRSYTVLPLKSYSIYRHAGLEISQPMQRSLNIKRRKSRTVHGVAVKNLSPTAMSTEWTR